MNSAPDQDAPQYDVVVIGGSLSGAATATLLLRKNPGLKLLVVEKSTRFTRRVGEATVEVSAFFLGRILGMTQHLNESHLVKQGMRFWFTNEEVASLDQASELGGRYQVRLPSYQLDRAVFDEEVLRRACAAGAALRRPASVTKVRLSPGGEQTITLRSGDTLETVRTRWVVDASGVAAFLARQQGWWQSNTAHPISAAWGRWKGVKDWDGYELAQKYPEWASAPYGIRGTATNHVVGDGWWSWWIPLKGGDVSVGVVFDQRLVDWPQDGGTLGERLKQFLIRHPVAREMLAEAHLIDGDVHWRKDLAYFSTKFAGDGFVLVGDAAGFMDPFYSPGMDWISFTSACAAELISRQRRGESLTAPIEHHNTVFAKSYHRWFQAVYQDKYEYIGEYDLMRLAFLLDLGLYYLGIVSQPFKMGMKGLLAPPFSEPLSRPVFALMRTYNRRFARIARRRRQLDLLGRSNRAKRFLANGFTLSRSDIRLIFKSLFRWAMLEVREGWRTWQVGEKRVSEPVPVSVGEKRVVGPTL
jgi:flavin-dependent dehydrogenase